jgi:hypothetical protein
LALSAKLIVWLSSHRFPIYSYDTPPVLDVTDPSTSLHSPIQQDALNSGANTSADIGFFSHVPDYVHLGPVQQGFKPIESPLNKELLELPHYKDRPEDLLNLHKDPTDNPRHEDNVSAYTGPFHSEPTEDKPDPFMVKCDKSELSVDGIQSVPDHLLVIYMIVAWLHMQFSLPCVACNALLAFLACLLMFLVPGIQPPFVTLHSATHTLGVDPRIHLLAICPNCRDVFPSAGSKYMQDECTTCKTPLFLSDQMKQGNSRTIKMLKIKYPYLLLSDQITSLLKIPGIEAVLDQWCTKPHSPGEYNDIFDGDMCCLKLRAPDRLLFFSNQPHERNGPGRELCISVNLGVDWYMYDPPCF